MAINIEIDKLHPANLLVAAVIVIQRRLEETKTRFLYSPMLKRIENWGRESMMVHRENVIDVREALDWIENEAMKDGKIDAEELEEIKSRFTEIGTQSKTGRIL